MREALGWLRAHLLDDDRLVRPDAVRVQITGERPARTAGARWRAGRRRAPASGACGSPAAGACARSRRPPTARTAPTRYRYDPADPTPSLGGPLLLARHPVVDNAPLEARADVLTYTTEPLAQAVEAIGVARAELHVRCSTPYFDVFARVCDVDARACRATSATRSRGSPPSSSRRRADGSWLVAFDLWPLGHRFAAGHRIRLQVSSGAHPRYARNPGTGEDPATATAMRAVDIELLHGAQHPSYLVLPAA